MKDDFFEKQLFTMTTIIYSVVEEGDVVNQFQGSGFYYTEWVPVDKNKKGAQWHRIEKHWLVTCKHVVLPYVDGSEKIPDRVEFCLRKNDGYKIEWMPIVIEREDLLNLIKFHKNPQVDVAVIDVTSFIIKYTQDIADEKIENNIMFPLCLSNYHLPQHQPITIDVTTDVIVASYPKGYYDYVNKFPIVKSGIVASAWEFHFRGLPMFQIDAQLFPGSSGGMVISKPTNIAMINGELKYSKTKEFVLLGVYSGETKWYEETEIAGKKYRLSNSYGLGDVWYSYLIPQIIKDGVKYSETKTVG